MEESTHDGDQGVRNSETACNFQEITCSELFRSAVLRSRRMPVDRGKIIISNHLQTQTVRPCSADVTRDQSPAIHESPLRKVSTIWLTPRYPAAGISPFYDHRMLVIARLESQFLLLDSRQDSY